MEIDKKYNSKISHLKIGEVIFSQGTYEIEVFDTEEKKVYWPFLQLDDQGTIIDLFCTCSISEKGRGCPHLAGAYAKIKDGIPLHVRYKNNFFNALCHIQARRNNYQIKNIRKKDKSSYLIESKTHKLLFSIETKTKEAQEKLDSNLWKKIPETEENSIKFSGLSEEEIANWKAGRPSPELCYELSFWSDLAKWLFSLQEEGQNYQITFIGEPVPQYVQSVFPSLCVQFYIARAHLVEIIPALSSVESPLKVHEEGQIEKITYDPEKKMMYIHPTKHHVGNLPKNAIAIDGWYFVPNDGFYFFQDIFEKTKEIPQEEIGSFLEKYGYLVQKYLDKEKIALDPVDVHYDLFFDEKNALHVQCYLFERGDLQQSGAATFFPWIYLPKKGFFYIKEPIFQECETVIAKENMAEFVSLHRVFLQNFDHFQTHLGIVESRIYYHFTDNGDLLLDTKIDLPEVEAAIDFGQWIYVPMQGFYAKEWKQGEPIQKAHRIPKKEIAQFLEENRGFLEQIEGFFITESPIVKMGLHITVQEEGKIVSTPSLIIKKGVKKEDIRQFGRFIYYEGHGFYPLAQTQIPPMGYEKKKVIPRSEERTFVIYILPKLHSFIHFLDKKIQVPQYLQVHIRKIETFMVQHRRHYLANIAYVSDMGSISLTDLYFAYQSGKKMLFTAAGAIDLTDRRFLWIKSLSKDIVREKHSLVLTPLEWIRLCVFEEIIAPTATTEEALKTKKLLEDIKSFKTEEFLDLSLLRSTLWPYQKLGAQWLWFLYCHGLSGLLCDEMGLGKTHQAMALLAAVGKMDATHRFLVVCPTSVIYHWKDLLSHYLPSFTVDVFHGIKRKISADSQIILTSYGTLRHETDLIGAIAFEVAIFDELQIAKNYTSKTHKALASLDASMRIGLSGTPIENRLRELKSLFDLVLPNYLPKEGAFREMFILPIEKYGDKKAQNLLFTMIKPFILRRKKQEVLLELPEKMEEIAYTDLSDEQKKMYNDYLRQNTKELFDQLQNSQKTVNYMHIFSILSKLKQLCDHPCLITKKIDEYEHHHSGKWDLFVELLNETVDSNQKLVVFSQYLDMIAIIEKYLIKRKISFASIKGATKDRPLQLKKFQNDPSCRVFVGSLLAAGVGIDLTAASVVIHYDRWWNPAKENQATDRVHRIGQNRGVQVFKLVTKGTIEERIHTIIESKKGLIEETIGQDDLEQIKTLSREDLIRIFAEIAQDE